ncbi:hypothetical protein [Sphingobium phenoxybenzoativorans]|uniref:hypothetical protein n=1 Tax=Sphingobium phenoxybenzoativorans TaxID=1592790 RepID=UPI001112FF1E|nr:hypothetical protein [Sphingobium phenoxybenzoativorans]
MAAKVICQAGEKIQAMQNLALITGLGCPTIHLHWHGSAETGGCAHGNFASAASEAVTPSSRQSATSEPHSTCKRNFII